MLHTPFSYDTRALLILLAMLTDARINEQTPLLGVPNWRRRLGVSSSTNRTPLPCTELLLAALIRPAEPLNRSLILPFVNQLRKWLSNTARG